MEKLLKSKKLRITDFRLEVLNAIGKYKNAVTINQIENQLKNFDRITLYRTVKTFIEKGILHEIVMPGEIKKLAFCQEDCGHQSNEHKHQHLHFKCDKCSEVFCLFLNSFPEIKYPKFKIRQVEIQGSGICSNCK